MTDEVTPAGQDQVLTELDIRIWLRDKDPTANLLLDDFEFSPEEMRTAMTLTIDKWNDTPPYIGSHDIDSWPYRSALLTGTAANLLFIAAHRYRRNSLKYNIPGGAVADQEKYMEYDSAGQKLWQDYVSWLTHNKRALNMEMGWGMVGVTYGQRYQG